MTATISQAEAALQLAQDNEANEVEISVPTLRALTDLAKYRTIGSTQGLIDHAEESIERWRVSGQRQVNVVNRLLAENRRLTKELAVARSGRAAPLS